MLLALAHAGLFVMLAALQFLGHALGGDLAFQLANGPLNAAIINDDFKGAALDGPPWVNSFGCTIFSFAHSPCLPKMPGHRTDLAEGCKGVSGSSTPVQKEEAEQGDHG